MKGTVTEMNLNANGAELRVIINFNCDPPPTEYARIGSPEYKKARELYQKQWNKFISSFA